MLPDNVASFKKVWPQKQAYSWNPSRVVMWRARWPNRPHK